jgi:tRNA pseudouridine32 synthase/23S rRNA pseudouridine746 synthase
LFSPLNTSKAKEYCLKLQADFDKYGVEAVVYGGAGDSEVSEDGEIFKDRGASVPDDIRQCASLKSAPHTSVYAKKPERPDGQMFGILVCTDSNGNEVVLKAFSGQFRSVWNIPGWAPPLLSESEFARLTEKSDETIHELTAQIEELESCGAVPGQDNTPELREKLCALKEKRRAASKSSMEEIFALYKIPVLAALETAETYTWTNPKNGKSYPRYRLRPALEYKSIFEFYGNSAHTQNSANDCGNENNCSHGKMPPTGAGECCAPKLIAQAYSLGLRPISLAEFYYGESPLSGEKLHKQFYEPCDEKCGPLLPAMLGLKVLYQDEAIVVVEKPSELLSVPGRGAEKQDCIVNRVKFLFGGDIGWCDASKDNRGSEADLPDSRARNNSFPRCIEQPAVHRLDMETSGILVLALTDDAHRNLNRQFEDSAVKKQYEAVLDGIPQCIKDGVTDGRLELPFRLDVENRPRQIYDEVYGKIGITEWKFLRYEKGGRVRLLFTPLTGRTHQLRLHSADAHGLGVPIVGDTLYGTSAEKAGAGGTQPAQRLLLHARMLEFTHPVTGARMKFESPAQF